MTTFELVPDDERDEHPASPDGDDGDDGAARRLRAAVRDRAAERWRRLSRRARVAVSAGTAVVLLACATAAAAPALLDARAERLRAETVHGLPGAVDDLSEPLTVTWEVEDGNGILTTFPDGVALTSDGTHVWALDVAAGKELWRQDLGPDPTCGPSAHTPVDVAAPVDVVVCLTGDPDDRTVTVLDATGAVVGERQIGPARDDPYLESVDGDVPLVLPAADGAVAVVDHLPSGISAPWVEEGSEEDDATTLRALRAEGWVDPTLRLEDAVTGEVRAEVTAPLRPEHLRGCNRIYETVDGENEVSVRAVSSVEATPSFTVLWACGASAGLTADGTPLDAPTSGGWPQALAGGGYVLTADESSVLATDGSVVATVHGWVYPPTVDADPGGPYLTAAGLDEGTGGVRLSAVGPDGRRDWGVETDEFSGVLARVAGTVVVQDGDRAVGLDAATGAELWARDGLLDRSGDGSGEWVAGVLTDGTRLLVGVNGDGAGHRLVTLDARDGTTVWERAGEGPVTALQAVDGQPVLLGSTLRGLGLR
jgi:outer membrane protein assembly factor BamB